MKAIEAAKRMSKCNSHRSTVKNSYRKIETEAERQKQQRQRQRQRAVIKFQESHFPTGAAEAETEAESCYKIPGIALSNRRSRGRDRGRELL